MKIAVCFLVFVSLGSALPAFDTSEVELLTLIPKDIFIDPVNPVKSVDIPGPRIIGGDEVAPNSIPYQVAVVINGNSLCGGSLISTSRVLSAAHCTIGASFVQVRLGAHNYNQNEATQVRLTSTSIINHASYNVGGFASNDISVVLLPTEVTFNENIDTVPLAPATAGTYEGSVAILTGWGRTSDDSSAGSPVLRGVNLNIISNEACRSIFGSVVLDSTICTSGIGTVGGCTGDSGGPLVVGGIQVGIVSFGSSRCEDGNPTAYARISAYRLWIQENAGV